MSARVSVVITTYNYGRFIGQCIDSVLSQTAAPSEIIVVDDGSTDDTRAVLARYGDRIKSIYQLNAGQAAALSAGIAETTGDIVCLLDADDVWAINKIERVQRVFDTLPDVKWLRHKLEVADEQLVNSGAHIPPFRGSGLIPVDARLILERIVTAATSQMCFRGDFVRSLMPLPAAEISGTKLVYDADAYLLASAVRKEGAGYSLDESLGQYRRHAHQQFVTSEDLERMIERQIHVGIVVAYALGLPPHSSIEHKHITILAALRGYSALSPSRVIPAARGIYTAIDNLADRPSMMFRQIGSVMLAYMAPKRWIRRLAVTQGLDWKGL